MSECIWTDCNNDARPKSPYCSGTCKKRAQRLSGTASGTAVPVEVGQEQVGQAETVPVKRTMYIQVVGAKVYGRQAVVCSQFKTRPEPINPTDQPVSNSRGRYERADGTVYQFDAVGTVFDCRPKVYETVEDVAAANTRRQAGVA